MVTDYSSQRPGVGYFYHASRQRVTCQELSCCRQRRLTERSQCCRGDARREERQVLVFDPRAGIVESMSPYCEKNDTGLFSLTLFGSGVALRLPSPNIPDDGCIDPPDAARTKVEEVPSVGRDDRKQLRPRCVDRGAQRFRLAPSPVLLSEADVDVLVADEQQATPIRRHMGEFILRR